MPAENRTWTAAAGTELEGSKLNEFQDYTVQSLPNISTWPTNALHCPQTPIDFRGATTIFGEYTVEDMSDKAIDTSRDWRGCTILMFACRVAAANELPSGANHTPDDIDEHAWILYNLHDDAGVGTNRWKPFAAADLYIYVHTGDGFLYASNTHAAPDHYYFYFMAQLTGEIS